MATIISAGTTTGTGVAFTPDTSGNLAFQTQAGANTITVPNVTGTFLTNKTAGTVLQVVSVSYSTAQTTTNTGGSYVDTGLTASITPTSSTSKILVIACQNGVSADSNSAGVNVQLYRGTTPIALLGVAVAYASAYINASCSVSYLDAPATTSSTTYKTGFCRAYNTGTVRVQGNSDTSTMTLIEIAA